MYNFEVHCTILGNLDVLMTVFFFLSFAIRNAGRSGLASVCLQQIDYQRNVIPPAMRSPTPMELFLCRSQTAGAHKVPGTFTFPENIHTHPKEGHWKFLGGRWGGGGGLGGYGYFLE